jgi:hypothetical protein
MARRLVVEREPRRGGMARFDEAASSSSIAPVAAHALEAGST